MSIAAAAPLTIDRAVTLARSIRARAEALSRSVNDEARRLAKEAGLDPNLLGIHPHNAMVSYRAGQPWPDIDYDKVRRVEYLLSEVEFAPTRLADRIIERLFRRAGR